MIVEMDRLVGVWFLVSKQLLSKIKKDYLIKVILYNIQFLASFAMFCMS